MFVGHLRALSTCFMLLCMYMLFACKLKVMLQSKVLTWLNIKNLMFVTAVCNSLQKGDLNLMGLRLSDIVDLLAMIYFLANPQSPYLHYVFFPKLNSWIIFHITQVNTSWKERTSSGWACATPLATGWLARALQISLPFVFKAVLGKAKSNISALQQENALPSH